MDAPQRAESPDHSRSLGSSLGYLQDVGHIIEHGRSPLLPDPEVSYGTLIACMVAFKILSKLTKGERPDVTADNVLRKYAKPEWTITRWWQSFCRFRNDQNTENDLNAIATLTDNALKCVKHPSKRETLVGLGEKLFLLYKINKYVHKALHETFPLYLETCASGISNAWSISPVILENRKRLGETVLGKIQALYEAIHERIARLEEQVAETSSSDAEAFLGTFLSSDESDCIPHVRPSLNDKVLNVAVKRQLESTFDPSLIQEMLRHYRLDHSGIYRTQDFLALTLGIIAQFRASDVTRVLDSLFGQEQKRVAYPFNHLRKVSLVGVTTPLRRYHRIFARDLDLLKAHQRFLEYSQSNQFTESAFRYAYLERDLLDLAPAFTRYPESPLIDGTVYECIEGTVYKTYELHPLISAKGIYAIALVPRENGISPTLRILITQHDNAMVDTVACNSALEQLARKTQGKTHNQRISFEIGVASTGNTDASYVLTKLLHGISAIPHVTFSNVNLHFWGPVTLSAEASSTLQTMTEKMHITNFSLRYFLYHNQSFASPAIPNLKLFNPRNQSGLPSNLTLSLLYFSRDRDALQANPTRIKRYFSLHDEEQHDNETYLSDLITNSTDDLNMRVRVDKRWTTATRKTALANFESILTPPPPSPGYLNMLSTGIATAYQTAGSYLPGYLKS